MPQRPEWLDWELELTGHIVARTVDRGSTEVELRAMIDDQRGWCKSHEPGRWILAAMLDGRRWEILVEPDFDDRVLVAVTACPVDDL